MVLPATEKPREAEQRERDGLTRGFLSYILLYSSTPIIQYYYMQILRYALRYIMRYSNIPNLEVSQMARKRYRSVSLRADR